MKTSHELHSFKAGDTVPLDNVRHIQDLAGEDWFEPAVREEAGCTGEKVRILRDITIEITVS